MRFNIHLYLVGTKSLRKRQYDPGIIEKTICLVLRPSTAMYRLFLKADMKSYIPLETQPFFSSEPFSKTGY